MNVDALDIKLATTSSLETHYTTMGLIWFYDDVLLGKKLKTSQMIDILEHVVATYSA